MSEVKRYHVTEAGLVEGKALGRINVVLGPDYDAAVTHICKLEQLAGQEMKSTELATNAGLRVCLERDALQALLTAADERADVLEGLLRTSLLAMSRIYEAGRDFIVGAGSDCDSVELMMENDPTAREIRAALKPAEGGGDHVKHYECIGKGGDYTVVAIAQGAGTLKGFNHYVYKNADGVHFVRDPEDFLSRMQIRP